MKALNRFAILVAASTVLLIAAGGMVTSTGSGLSVPDWPNTYGWFMFSFPLEKMVGGIFYEHGHRMIASAVGFLTIILAAWTWWVEPRRWVRRLAVAALAAVILQGLLGGITVLFYLPAPISIGHAALAQLFFCMTVGLALFTSRGWRAGDPADAPMLRRLALATTLVAYGQTVLGATMRHTGAGLAIPDFPLAFRRILPPVWSVAIAIHFAHRIGAVLVTAAILATAGHVWFHHRGRRELVRPAVLLVLLVALQATLGAFVVLSGLQPVINTAHVVNGALLLATSVVLTLRSFRPWFDRLPERRDGQLVSGAAAPAGARG
ncbi:MAG: COX15/CtaA family protein [Acidobacteria bacterium]|nr:COX15/CtaA family protein [Acidobacteriota bacterium]